MALLAWYGHQEWSWLPVATYLMKDNMQVPFPYSYLGFCLVLRLLCVCAPTQGTRSPEGSHSKVPTNCFVFFLLEDKYKKFSLLKRFKGKFKKMKSLFYLPKSTTFVPALAICISVNPSLPQTAPKPDDHIHPV